MQERGGGNCGRCEMIIFQSHYYGGAFWKKEREGGTRPRSLPRFWHKHNMPSVNGADYFLPTIRKKEEEKK